MLTPPSRYNEMFPFHGLNSTLQKIFWKLDACHIMEMDEDMSKIKSITNSPDPTPGALRLLGHKACAAEA